MRRRGLKILGGIMGAIFIMVIGFLIYRLIVITNIERAHRIQTENGIEEECIVKIGGINQYLNIRGEDLSNPIIIVVHGGMPMTPMIHTYQSVWEKEYTVINWDRRGSGETYYLNKADTAEILENLNVEVLIQDLYEVTEYVEERFGQEKVIILGDSLGSIIGSSFAVKHPEKVLAYIGSAQLTNIPEDFQLFAEDLQERAIAEGNDEDAKQLQELGRRIKMGELLISEFQEEIMPFISKYHYATGSAKNAIDIYMNGLTSPYFPISHLPYYFKVNEITGPLLEEASSFFIQNKNLNYEVPVVFIIGEDDWIAKYTIKAYYQQVQAPFKKLIFIKAGDHDILQNQPETFYKAAYEALHEAGIK